MVEKFVKPTHLGKGKPKGKKGRKMKYPEPSTYCYTRLAGPDNFNGWCSLKPTYKVNEEEWLCTYHARRKGYLPKKEPKYNRTEMEDQVGF